ncbi:hypothetical protein [Lentimicrobium saccharophilum]|uniref:hypothetical protein n=1 Tax=Lentimicrobium saccharophilum TaxID=1678841 RepID=UPI00155D9D7E|nr:hypothetical protein [Lentimicrobium saccharophilum]
MSVFSSDLSKPLFTSFSFTQGFFSTINLQQQSPLMQAQAQKTAYISVNNSAPFWRAVSISNEEERMRFT